MNAVPELAWAPDVYENHGATVSCFCGIKQLDPEQASYVVDGQPCCTAGCHRVAISEGLETAGHVTHTTTYEQPTLPGSFFFPGDDGDPHAWDVV
jgi:hypothetical protein